MTDSISGTPTALRSFSFLVRRLPFSTVLVAAILATAAFTNTLAHPIPLAMLDRWGFGLEQIRDGRFYQLFLAPFQILRPYMAISIAGAVFLFVGACEYRLGTWRAVLAFWTGHIVGYVGAGVAIVALAHLGSGWAAQLMHVTDVGASNGAFGACGTVVLFLAGRARKTAFLLVSAFLAGALLIERRIWNIEHILAFCAGIGVGRIYLWQMRRHWPGLVPQWQIERRQRPIVVAWAVGLVGVVNVMGAFLTPHHPGFARLESWLPVGNVHWPRHLMLVCGIVLIRLVPGLARAQRTAWSGALIVLLVALVLQVHVGMTRLEFFFAEAFLLLLVAWGREFQASSHPPSLRSGIRLLIMLAIAVPLYGLIGFFILRSQFDPPVTARVALVETVSRVFFSTAQGTIASNRLSEWFLRSIPLVAWLGAVSALGRIIRSALAPEVSTTDREAAHALLSAYGSSGTSYMTLWKGNSLFFGPARQCYVAYRVNAGVAVALGDPVGRPEARAETIGAFERFAGENGWESVFYGATAPVLEEYGQAGYDALHIGEEAIIRLPGLEFHGKEWQNLRSAINRANRMKVAFQMFEGGRVPPDLRAQLFEISAEWASHKDLPPMGFTLGTTEDVDDPNVNVAIAVDASGRVHAYADWLPVYARRGWVIDLMRRRSDAMGGAMDFLVGMSLMEFKERGYEMASLATAPLADLDRAESSSWVQWVLGKVFDSFETYYDFRTLFRYKEKFQPAWESVYLTHRGLATLPPAAAAILKAHLPDLNLLQAVKLLGASAAARIFPGESPTGPAGE